MEKIDLSRELIEALSNQYRGNIQAARANVRVYLENPAGIGEHPDIIQSIDSQIQIIADNQEKLDILNSRRFNFSGSNFPVE
jgi:hypothetical protein|tara:strand:- start:1106 stop:1351 length:246 start_codon:yes stop_codon:yes gene_type:complete